MKVVDTKEMKFIENRCVDYGIAEDQLMENAGKSIAKIINTQIKQNSELNVLILIGPGNNGGDGFVAGRYLEMNGANVTYYQCCETFSDLSMKMFKKLNTPVVINYKDDLNFNKLKLLLRNMNVVIDAFLGTGVSRPITDVVETMFQLIANARDNNSNLQIISIDIPSGINPDNGTIGSCCIKADITICLGFSKIGLFEYPASQFIGQLLIADIGIPKQLISIGSLNLLTVTETSFPIRSNISHKGTFGSVLVIGGSKNYIGAPVLAANAAFRIGAGLVSIAYPKNIQTAIAAQSKEIIHIPLSLISKKQGWHETIAPYLSKVSSVVIGCGLGQDKIVKKHLPDLMKTIKLFNLPTVIDADALNNLKDVSRWWEIIPEKSILTPHPGEMSAITNLSKKEIQSNRIATSIKYAKKWNVILILKGAMTVIAFPNGKCYINPFACSILATAGTGDVLAGIIAGFIAQELKEELAVMSGVLIHSKAAEILKDKFGSGGALASELILALPTALRMLQEHKKINIKE